MLFSIKEVLWPIMTQKERYRAFVKYCIHTMPEATTELNYRNAFELLVAVILSAQCTDKRINLVTPSLFAAFPTAFSMAKSDEATLLSYIKSVSYPRSKASYLIKMSRILVEKFDGIPPSNIDDLQTMPGVGRKTAHVIASVIYKMPVMAVDTHVMRVSKRMGLVSAQAKTPLAIEQELVKFLDKAYIGRAHSWLILHGRYICRAKNPQCSNCPLQKICLFYSKKNDLLKN